MKLRCAMLVVAAVATAETPARAQLLSPGPLSRAHKSVEGDHQCSDCHSSGKKIDESKCLGCHPDLRKRIRAGAGLHGKTYRGQACVRCHVEHLGRGTRLVRWPRKNRRFFNHADAGWPLRGAHARQVCDKCHDKRNHRGARTYLGLRAQCTSCHKDQHQGRLGSQCLGCHTESSWKVSNLRDFNHDLARFKLRGKHQPVACAKCHGEPARWTGIKFADCGDCHEDPHRGQFRKQTCASCHSETGWNRLEGFRRRHPGVRLVRGHRRVGCRRCHDRGNTRPPSKGRACVSCHEPVHVAKFGRNCKSCHASIEWVGLRPEVGRKHHRKTRYPLEGSHQKVACQRCHPRSRKPAKRFRGIKFDRCDGCHQDRHEGDFERFDNGECAACHTVRGFRPANFGAQLHAKTRFPLDGRHAATPCARCHKSDRPRLHFKATAKTCADCHANPHGDQFAAEMRKGGCASCHNTGGWSRPNIDHSIWPLQGAHARTDCGGCHQPSAADRERGRGASYRGVPRDCEGCHDDVHAGQFRNSAPNKSCSACHGVESFAIAAFDHTTDGRYELAGAHTKLECKGCHPTVTLKNKKRVVRYRLGYRACKDCHANPHPD